MVNMLMAAWAFFLVIVGAVTTPFVFALGQQNGWFDDPNSKLAGAFGDLAWVGNQWWYTHGAIAVFAFSIGILLGWRTRPKKRGWLASVGPIIPKE